MKYPNFNMSKLHKNYQLGLGIIELMVSIAIGLFLLLGLATTYFNMKNTSTSRQGLSEVQNKERVATTFIASAIRTAGQFTQPCVASTATNPINCSSSIDSKFVVSSPFALGQIISGTSGASAGKDTLSTRFSSVATTDVVGCGAATISGTLYTDVFGIDTLGNLVCTETPNTGTAVSYTLASGLAGMQVLYGVSIENNADVYSNYTLARYYSAANMTAALWADVLTVNVTLAFIPANQTSCTLPSTWPSTWAASVTNKCVMISRIISTRN